MCYELIFEYGRISSNCSNIFLWQNAQVTNLNVIVDNVFRLIGGAMDTVIVRMAVMKDVVRI